MQRANEERVRCAPVVVGVGEASRMLNTSEQRVRELIAAGLLATVPNLSTPSKIAIAVRELERFAAAGVMPLHFQVAS